MHLATYTGRLFCFWRILGGLGDLVGNEVVKYGSLSRGNENLSRWEVESKTS
ncbi:hypothetical protein THOE12_20156 [Vibrio rotiferianus]|nr:hypothetical protein THOE12_20156 [Vibrio rotiferianus]